VPVIQGFDLTPPLPLPDQIAAALRRLIITGRLAPGSRINESELASTYHISRSPIREALRILQQEGLVVMEPRRGAFVRRLTEVEVAEVYDVKAMLEGHATALAARRIDTPGLDALSACVERMGHDATRPDPAGYIERTREFHDLIVRASANRTLAGLYHALDQQIHWLRSLSLSRPGRIAQSLADHRAILDAIANRDEPRAERLAREHIGRAAADLVPTLARLLDGGSR
jgi:DNA-binding GntR family transcriptional regulator